MNVINGRLSAKKLQRRIFTIISLVAILSMTSMPSAFAATSITWDLPLGYAISDGSVGGTPITFDVSDSDLNGNGLPLDSIDVTITSSVDSTGIQLTLTETSDNGEFTNDNLVFLTDDSKFSVTDTATITIQDNCDSGGGQGSGTTGNCDPNSVDTLVAGSSGATIKSETDTTGISISLTETGIDTSIFTATLSFCTTSSCSDSSSKILHVSAGDVITIIDQVTSAKTNGIITPMDDTVGAIKASIGGTVTASYNGVSKDVDVLDDGESGRGGGGLVRPGLELDSSNSGSDPDNSGGGGCEGDCEPPTLGLDQNYKRIVKNGFSYNDKPVDVERYYTPYPLITVNVGQENKAVFKVYDNSGTQSISTVALAFGLGKGEYFGESRATITLERTWDGREIVTVFDPEDVLENVDVITEKVNCNGDLTARCLLVTFYHTFRAPLDFNMVASYVWDVKRNAWQNYYNHGVAVIGESLNPPEFETLVDRYGHVHKLQTDQVMPGIRLDENNSPWILIDDTWEPYRNNYSQLHSKFFDSYGSPNVVNRDWELFNQLKDEEISKAEQKLIELLGPHHTINPYLKNR